MTQADLIAQAVALLGQAVSMTLREVAPAVAPQTLRAHLARNVERVLSRTPADAPLRSMMEQILDTVDP